MAIQFVVETGTGSATATSYSTVAQYKQYWENRGVAITDSDAVIQGYLNAATEYIDINYNFLGSAYSSTQALQFPRVGLIDSHGYEILYSTIPQKLIDATCYLARQKKTGDLLKVDNGVKSESYGPISKTYSGSSASVKYQTADKLLSSFISSGVILKRVN